MSDFQFSVAEALKKLSSDPDAKRYFEVFSRGTLTIELYAPRGTDPQTPHTRNEIYVVIEGRGKFQNGAEITDFSPGDVLFVPAGADHRFVNFSDDLTVWGIFYGPDGGES